MDSKEHITKTEIEGVLIVDIPAHIDERGFFKETFRKNELEEILGKQINFVQENHARSKKGVLRGIHVAPWSKFFYCVKGSVQHVVVDLRKDSPTFGKYISNIIGDGNQVKVFIPAGCGNSYLILSDEADVIYLTDDYYSPGKEFGVSWNDPELSINWEIKEPVLSEKDQSAPKVDEVFHEE